MQEYCTELTERLSKSLDKEYNVVDMGVVVDVITALEKTSITKEVLENTRLGRYVNGLRRKTTNDVLAKRAKDLVRKWRETLLPSAQNSTQMETLATGAQQQYQTVNGTKPQSPLARVIVKQPPQSPAGAKGLKQSPQSPLLRDVMPMKVISPALSLNSDQNSRSPKLTKLPTTLVASNYRLNSSASPKLSGSNQNHSVEAVPRTHSSNKRLRKDETLTLTLNSSQKPLTPSENDVGLRVDEMSMIKKQRVNGENVVSIDSQVPSPSPSSRDHIHSLDLSVTSGDNLELDMGPKKRGRKKGSKSLKNQLLPEDRVKEKLASISRNPKIKTTQELLADLQARGSNVEVATSTNVNNTVLASSVKGTQLPTADEILRASDLNNRIKVSTRVPDVASTQSDNLPTTSSTVEDILSQLPPLDLDSIRWSENEETNEDDTVDRHNSREINCHDVDRLHNECIEGLNGNFQLNITRPHGIQDTQVMKKLVQVYKRRDSNDGTDREFREWHEMLARPSCDGQILHILPYVIID